MKRWHDKFHEFGICLDQGEQKHKPKKENKPPVRIPLWEKEGSSSWHASQRVNAAAKALAEEDKDHIVSSDIGYLFSRGRFKDKTLETFLSLILSVSACNLF